MSLSASSSRKTNMGLAAADSTISLEGLEQADIGEWVSIASCTYEARENKLCTNCSESWASSCLDRLRAAEE